jgi:membrane protein implicated in regulation of membrane protease activity
MAIDVLLHQTTAAIGILVAIIAATTLLVSLGILSVQGLIFVIIGVVIIATIARFYKWLIIWQQYDDKSNVKHYSGK